MWEKLSHRHRDKTLLIRTPNQKYCIYIVLINLYKALLNCRISEITYNKYHWSFGQSLTTLCYDLWYFGSLAGLPLQHGRLRSIPMKILEDAQWCFETEYLSSPSYHPFWVVHLCQEMKLRGETFVWSFLLQNRQRHELLCHNDINLKSLFALAIPIGKQGNLSPFFSWILSFILILYWENQNLSWCCIALKIMCNFWVTFISRGGLT